MIRLEGLLLVELPKKHLDVLFLPLRITRHLLNRHHNALNALSLIGAELWVMSGVRLPQVDQCLEFVFSFRHFETARWRMTSISFLVAIVKVFDVIVHLLLQRVVMTFADSFGNTPLGQWAAYILGRALGALELVDVDLVQDCLKLNDVLGNFEVDFLFFYFFLLTIVYLDVSAIVKGPEVFFLLELIPPTAEYAVKNCSFIEIFQVCLNKVETRDPIPSIKAREYDHPVMTK